jgi:hypothetical protein
MVAAMNLLALDIPYHIVPFWTSKQYDKLLQFTGVQPMQSAVHYQGNPEELDFVAYYEAGRGIQFACGTQKDDNRMIVVNEGLRLQIMPDLNEFSVDDIDYNEWAKTLRVTPSNFMI